MAHDAAEVLVGAAARPEEREAMERVLAGHPDVVEVQELLTSVLGPRAILVCARLDLRDDINARQIEQMSDELDQALREAVPDVTEVFLDATPPRARRGTAPAPTPA
jgi:divalent metal cation (Fe/Co/Zn/Cd) transporter